MKLAVVGVVVAAIGLVIGVDGLVFTGGFWIITGLLARMLILRRQEEMPIGAALTRRDESEIGRIAGREDNGVGYRLLGLGLLLVIGLGSMAIGFFDVGFSAEYESLRWLPFAVGILITTFVLITIPIRFGAVDLEALAEGAVTTPATVTIQGRRETGTYINDKPRIEFDLLVEPEDRPSYRITKKATVPPIALGSIAIGDGFKVELGPGDDPSIAIDWDSPIDGADGGDPSERLKKLEDLRRHDLINPEEYDEQRERILGSI